MLQEIRPEQVLFIDIETVPQFADYADVPESKKKFWEHKSSFLKKNETDGPESLYERAGIYSEFGRIICISSGILKNLNGKRELHIKSFSGDDEKTVLQGFHEVLEKLSGGSTRWYLCAHNGREFDFPYIARRGLVNGLPVPPILDVRGKWQKEIQLLDTLELWKFGDYKHYVSLDLLADIFGIPSPKDDIDGSMVCDVYYREKNLPRIVEYCQRDIVTLAQVFLKFKREETVQPGDVHIV